MIVCRPGSRPTLRRLTARAGADRASFTLATYERARPLHCAASARDGSNQLLSARSFGASDSARPKQAGRVIGRPTTCCCRAASPVRLGWQIIAQFPPLCSSARSSQLDRARADAKNGHLLQARQVTRPARFVWPALLRAIRQIEMHNNVIYSGRLAADRVRRGQPRLQAHVNASQSYLTETSRTPSGRRVTPACLPASQPASLQAGQRPAPIEP